MKIKEGGGMELQKEREAFQKFCEENFDFERHEQTYFDEQTRCYENDIGEDTESINMAWSAWQSAKAQAVPEKTVKLHLVWNENKDECVGFLDSKDARYTATGDDRGMFGVTALGDYFRDLNDERDEFETEVVMIEAQEPAND